MHEVAAPDTWSQLATPTQYPCEQLAPQVAPHLPATHPLQAVAAPEALSQETVPVHEPWTHDRPQVAPHCPAAHDPEHEVARPVA